MWGVQIIVATPGRMNDFLELKSPPVLKDGLSGCEILVLDEADRMLDMGFEPQIRTIIEALPKEHQTMMFTATWPKAVQRLAREYLRPNPVQINIGNSDQLVANKSIKQHIHQVWHYDKEAKLVELFNTLDQEAWVIVFANKKHLIESLVCKLRSACWRSVSIHGDKEQWQREEALQKFSSGQIRVIVATDVAARGLDIKGVTHVINYDMPMAGAQGIEDWVHRTGRTGRAGKDGIAHSFFNPKDDEQSAPELVDVLKDAGQEIPAWLQEYADKNRRRKGKGKGGKGKGKGRSKGKGKGKGSFGKGKGKGKW